MKPAARHVGHTTLALLVEDWSLPILRALMDGPRRPHELEHRLPEIPHSPLMHRLGELRTRGLAQHVRHSGLRPEARYTLSPPGRSLLSVMAAAERWEQAWEPQAPRSGLSAIQLVADERKRQILLALAPGPLSAAQLEQQLAIPRTSLRNRLADMVERQLLEHSAHRYGLNDRARDLMLVAVAAARWAWEFDRPTDDPTPANVARILQMFAPAAQLAADLEGACAIRIDGPDAAVVILAAEGRSLRPLTDAPGATQATCEAPPRAWCDGLLLCQWEHVTSRGDRGLMAAVLASLTAALFM